MGTVHQLPGRRFSPEQAQALHQRNLHRAGEEVARLEDELRQARAELRRCERLVRMAGGGAGVLTSPPSQATADARTLWGWASKWPSSHPLQALLQRAAERAEVEARTTNPSNPGVPAPEPLP